jgi:signal transduction histidine kinase
MHGFRRTLFLSHLGLVALALLLLAVSLRGLATRYFAEQLRDRLISRAATVRNRVASHLDGAGWNDDFSDKARKQLESDLRRTAAREGLRIRVVNREARAVFDTLAAPGESVSGRNEIVSPELGWSFGDRPEVIAALQGETNSRVRGTLRDGSSAMFLAMPIRHEGEILGCVYATSPVLALTPQIVGYARTLAAVTLAVFVLAAILSVALAQRLALPARRIEETSRRLAAGDLAARVAMHRRFLGRGDEMDALMIAINDMAVKLEETDATRRAFLADVSHELRTPLAAIKGSAETLRDGAWKNPEFAPKFSATIALQSDRLIRLVNDLLRLARLENSPSENAFRTLQACEVLDHAASAVAHLFDEREVNLKIECEADTICGDADLLEQLLINLLANAARHSPAHSTTTLSARRNANAIELVVRDEGKGIAPEHLPKLGERFYRVEEGRDRDSGGSGLGLAICRRIALAHSGILTIESEVGSGTEVVVSIPND